MTINTEAKRKRILLDGGLYYKTDKNQRGPAGRQLKNDILVAGVHLKKMDVLMPTKDLIDVADFRSISLPLAGVFWRSIMERRTLAIKNTVHWRNPLLSRFRDPMSHLHLDTLHTVYLGPCKHYVGWVIHLVLAANPWGFESSAATRMTLGGLLYAAYSIPPVLALPNMDNSSDIIDGTVSFSMSFQMLMTTSLGFADAPGAFVERSSSQLTA